MSKRAATMPSRSRWFVLEKKDIADIQSLQRRVDEWQRMQFPNADLDGAARHLLRELDEAMEELADVFFLASQCERLGGIKMGIPETAFHSIRMLGGSPVAVILAKLEKNKRRRWPTTPDEEGCYEAIDAKDENEK